ncbi:endospore germination permease [Paenibacillus solisilvae]|uniref:Endospore germination permease n=1 Tax=Paenibacillus solisilvae TaxID=2486751 RepID=A0ABW0VUB5_9BACL
MKITITANQAALFLFVFLTSSSIINIPSPLISFAGNSAWLSLIFSAICGLLIAFPVIWLARVFPGKSFIEYSREVVGTPITFLLGLPFLFYQIHMAAAIVLDIAMFMKSSMMRETPAFWFIFLTFMVVAVSVHSGIDKITGLFPVLMGNVLFFVFLIIIMSYKNYHPSNIFPIMPDGVKPFLHGVYFSFGFPYVEIVLFSMVLPYVPSLGKKFGRKLSSAILWNAFCLVAATVVTIFVFGPIAGERKYSLFEVARTVNIADVFQRIEALIGYSLIVASFMKTTIVLFTAHQTCIHLIGLKEDKMLIYPLAMLMAIISCTAILKGDVQWGFEVSAIHPMWGFTCAGLPLLIVFIVALLRKKKPAAAAS